jgi:hypothetical protein
VKWLLVPAEEYLRNGSLPQDYTQDQSLYCKSYQFDHDIAQQFTKFTLHESERHSHGVRFIHTRNNGSLEPQTILQCCVLSFGCLALPYLATQGQERIMEMVEGDPQDNDNPFQYAKCILNLQTSKNYDPSMPKVMLIRKDGELASRLVTFVDDHHGAGRGRDGLQAKECSSNGVQDEVLWESVCRAEVWATYAHPEAMEWYHDPHRCPIPCERYYSKEMDEGQSRFAMDLGSMWFRR